MTMRHIDEHSVAMLADYPDLIDEIEAAFRASAEAPLRGHLDLSNGGRQRELLTMPAWNDAVVAVKLATIFPENVSGGIPAVSGIVVLFDGDTGAPLAVIDAAELTARRTAAASALASRYLSRADSTELLVVGTGKLSAYLVAAHDTVRQLSAVTICGRTPARAEAVASRLNLDQNVRISTCQLDDLPDVIGRADIISTATRSISPLLNGDWLMPGQHVDLVGGYRPDMREADDRCIERATLFVDTREGALVEAGDIVQPIRSGIIDDRAISADLFDLCNGKHGGRESDREITLFKSVGTAIEDLAAATMIFNKFELDERRKGDN